MRIYILNILVSVFYIFILDTLLFDVQKGRRIWQKSLT